MSLTRLVREVRGCTVCASHLPLGPRPIVSLPRQARILLIGQAPGTAVHESGIAWDDPSGDHLREWMGVSRDTFYTSKRIGIMPMGLCYPGKKKGGDAPPRPECAPLWHDRIRAALPDVKLTLLIGRYAHQRYLGKDGSAGAKNVTEAVRSFGDQLPGQLALPHPSWRSKIWMRKNPWFEEEVLPALRETVAGLLR
jgi:uracil-DNA glycosylase